MCIPLEVLKANVHLEYESLIDWWNKWGNTYALGKHQSVRSNGESYFIFPGHYGLYIEN